MGRNPALIDLQLFLAKTKVKQAKIKSESSLIKYEENMNRIVENSTT